MRSNFRHFGADLKIGIIGLDRAHSRQQQDCQKQVFHGF
jgi:hypothetical protein